MLLEPRNLFQKIRIFSFPQLEVQIGFSHDSLLTGQAGVLQNAQLQVGCLRAWEPGLKKV